MASSEVLASLAVKISAQTQEFDRALNATQKNLQKASGQIDGITKGISGAFKGIAGAIASSFAIDSITAFGSKIFSITAEFQKFEAVLTNTLGSSSAAQAALTRIQEFAAKTPFGVREVTEEFIKLANRGINVTNSQLTKIGDVAAALGKPLGQVNEAILDVSNTERWNELGIKVQSNGDKMTGTFKGLTVEVDRTEKGALSMIERFGEMQGVAGGMESVSKTLGGQMSNLGDSFDKLFNTIGGASSGLFSGAIQGVAAIVDSLTAFISGSSRTVDAAKDQKAAVDSLETSFSPLVKRYDELTGKTTLSADEQKELKTVIKQIGETVPTAITGFDQYGNALDISSEKAKAFIKSQQAILSIKNKDAISEQTDALKTLDRQIAETQYLLKNQTKYQVISSGQAIEVKLTADEITNLQAKLGDLQNQKLGTQGLINELKGIKPAAVEAGNAIAEAAVKPIPLLTQLNNQLAEQKKKLAEATTEGDVSAANQRIASIEAQIKRLEELGIANSKINDILRTHNEEMGKSAALADLWGSGYDLIGEKAKTLTKTIEDLVTNGLSVQSAAVQKLKAELDTLGADRKIEMGSFEQISRPDDQFGSMVTSAQLLTSTFNEGLTPSLDRVAAGIGGIAVTAPAAADIFNNAMTEQAEYANQFGGVIGSMNGLLAGFGDAMLDTAFTGASFGEGILKAVADFAANFGKQIIAIGIAKIGLDKLFATPGGAAIAIAGGVALMAVAKALSAASANKLSAATGGAGGGGAGSSPRSSTIPGSFGAAKDPIEIKGETRISNKDIVISYTNGVNEGRRTS